MSQVSQRDRDFILNPYVWPHLHLPLRKPRGPLAVLMTATEDETQPLRILINQTVFGLPLAEVEEKTYDNVDALLADGWVVD